MKLKNILNEIELKVIREALPLDTAKKYVSIERNPAIQKQIDDIFNKLKPKAKYQSKRGDRLYIELDEEYDDPDNISDNKIYLRINRVLNSYGYSITNYAKGLTLSGDGRTEKIGKVLNKIKNQFKKRSDAHNTQRIQNLINNFGSDPARDGSNLSNLFIVISKHPYDIAGKSTDRGWNSCMNVYGGGMKHYVSCDIREGTLEAYLIKESDKNINKPIARISIKPFVNVKDSDDVLYVPEDRVYGTAPNSFKDTIVEIFEEIQNEKFGSFELKGYLYQDSKSSVDKIPKQIQDIFDGKTKPKTKEEVEVILAILQVNNYTINEDLTVDILGSVNLSNKLFNHKLLRTIPISFGKVTGTFLCNDNKLNSLENSPVEVGTSFYCNDNNLTSLEGAPKKVGGSFHCSYNKLTSLQGAPKEVGKNFYCNDNNLTSLQGAPKEVGRDFYCYSNNLTSLQGAPKEVGGRFYCNSNKLTSLQGAPKEVGENFYCEDNDKQFTEEDVRKVSDVKGEIYV